MKSTTICLFPFLGAAAAAAALAEPPPSHDLARAFVTIPYSELRALWEAGQSKPEPPAPPEAAPLPFLVHRADIRVALGEDAGKIEGEFEVESLEAKWHRIPLLGGEVRLEKATAGEHSIVWDDGYALLTNAPGRTPVALHLAIRGRRHLTTPLKMKLGSASVKRLSVSGIPDHLEARVNGQSAQSVDGVAVFLLSGDAGEVSLELATPKVDEAPKPLPPIAPSHWQTQSQVLVRYTEGRLRFAARLFAHADDGSGLEMTAALPGTSSAINVTGDDLADWSQTRSDDGRRLLRIRWKTRDVLDRELMLTYAVPQSSLSEQWTLEAPTSVAVESARHLYAMIVADGLELKGDALRTAVESRRLPEWMRVEIDGAAFVTAEAEGQLVLQTQWLPAIATAQAIVSEANASLRLVADGATQTAVSYTIKHQAPLAWQLELPAQVELLSCTIGGAPAQPIQRENGVIELPLPAPGKGATTVALVYTANIKPLDPVSGDVALELPRTPLFIERLDWSIVMPAVFEITAIDGNLSVAESVPDATRSDRTIALRKDFCRAERPVVSLFYQRRNLDK